MKKSRNTITAALVAGGALVTLASLAPLAVQAHEGEDHAASASASTKMAGAATKAADGHAHSHEAGHGHGDSDAIGVAGKPNKVSRTVNVDMTDTMRFNPASVEVKQGETIRFVVKNSGAVKHEFVLGTEAELKEHYELMKKFPEMEHADPNQVTVAPGKTGEVIWQFTKAGKVDFACLQPGHYDAGMKGAVTVAATKGAAKPATAAKGDGHADHKH